MAQKLKTLLIHVNYAGILTFDLIFQVLNALLLARLVSLSEELLAAGHLSDSAILYVFLKHFQLLHVLLKSFTGVFCQLRVTAAVCASERLRVTESNFLKDRLFGHESRIFVIFVGILRPLVRTLPVLALGLVLFGDLEATAKVCA